MALDLFTPIVPTNRQHPNFAAITSPRFEEARNVITSWTDGFIDRDGKAIKEFQTTFNSTFWELYLHASFKQLGFAADYAHEAPDFLLTAERVSFVAEATISSHPDGYTAEWEREISKEAIEKLDPEEIIELASVRLANALATKHKKYVESYSKLDHVKDLPFVVCVAPFEQPFFFEQSDNAMRRVLYSFDQYLYMDFPEDQQRVIFGAAMFDSIVKSNGTEIQLGFFTDDRMKEVSAVIFSNCATFGKVRALSEGVGYPIYFFAKRYNDHGLDPILLAQEKADYKETLLDGLHIFLNPHAERPLSIEAFKNDEVAIHWIDPESGQYMVEMSHNFLFQRSCMAINAVPDAKLKEARIQKPMMPHAAPPWDEGELHPVKAAVGPFIENHLAHFEGWTILVARDAIDGDWGAQAILAKVKTVPHFVRLNRTGRFQHLLGDGWQETKDEALEAMKAMITQGQMRR